MHYFTQHLIRKSAMKKLYGLFLLLCISTLTANQSIQLILQELSDQKIQFIDCKFCDIHGNLKSLTIPCSFAHNAFTRGLNFDGSSVPGCTSIDNSDLLLMPDLHTLHIIPWLDGQEKTAGVFCDICIDTNTPYASPRTILKNVLDEAHQMGFEFNVGPELEFFLVDKDLNTCDQKAYFDGSNDIDRLLLQRDILNNLHAQGVYAEKIHHEVAPGQHEISIRYGNAVAIADQIILAKNTIRTVAEQHNLNATFMPKPIFGQNGSAMHIHFSLWDTTKNRNAFSDENKPNELSHIAHQFLAGVLRHIQELNLIFNPTINSYKRLVPGYEAPIYICWGTKNRSAMIRIPDISENEESAVRAEIRSPDPSCNPYLAFAALLKAGLAGIQNKYELPAAAQSNVYHMNTHERTRASIDSLPVSLEQAIDFFKTSDFARELIGDCLHTELTKIKTKELNSFLTAVTNWEVEKYF